MRRPLLTLVAATAAGLTVSTLPALTGPATGTTDASAPLPAAASTVSLPTGDTVRLSTEGGRPLIQVLAADRTGPSASLAQLTVGGRRYVVPGEARPFVGRQLDPSLFDVDALAAATRNGDVPLSIGFAAGSAVDVPGLTVTARSATGESGYLTAAGAAAFRAALLKVWANVASGGPAPATLFGASRIALSGSSPTVTPHYPMVTLRVRVLDAQKAPADGAFVILTNVDDARRYGGFVPVFRGIARVSVPLGDYSGIADVGSFDPVTGAFTDNLVPIADFTVTKNLQQLTFDASTATTQPAVTTPQHAKTDLLTVEFDREAARGGSFGASFGYDGNATVHVAPTRRVRTGDLQWLTTWALSSPGHLRTPYTYDLSFPSYGAVPADLSEAVQQFQLATVHAAYYDPKHSVSQFGRGVLYPFQFFGFDELLPVATPTSRTEYVYAGDSAAVWFESLLAYLYKRSSFGGFIDNGLQVYPSGSERGVDWLRGPLAPAPDEQTAGDTNFYFCPACRTDNHLAVGLAPYTDTTPGHYGELYAERHQTVATFALYRDGTQIAGGPNRVGTRVSVPADSAHYRLTLAIDRTVLGATTSTATDSEWTFTSGAGSGAPLPPGWQCPVSGTGCTVLPLLKATLPLPTGLDDTVPTGNSSFVMTVAPFEGAGTATITSAVVSTSLDGTTFTDADVRRIDNNHYRVILHNPASTAGMPVTLRVHATDNHGGSLTQTTTAAYLVTAAA